MTLDIGTFLGSYEIVAPLGAGGMGEVYRARDPKLDREVAIKVLPEEFATDAERLARFEREAKALAALNHPNIASLYGFEQDGDTHFLVMELVEGEDLAERLARGPIPVAEAIPLFLQIAEGLEAAHEKGIVHRDLKPANIKVNEDGRAKILDFGLAKAVLGGDPETDPSASLSPTLSLAATKQGQILGTAAYMAPEQAQAQRVDTRADIWAFGVCLFETLTGKRVFRGNNAALVLASILRDEPPWGDLPVGLPPSVRRLLRRCLAKKRRDRLGAMVDARLELVDCQSEPEEPAGEPGTRVSRGSVALAALGAVALLSGLIALGVATRRASSSADPGVLHMSLSLPEGVEIPYYHMDSLALSPDGNQVAFMGEAGGERRIYLDNLTDADPAAPLAGSERGTSPFFSSDSQQVGYVTDQLVTVPLAGGDPVRHVAMKRDSHGGAVWVRDGSIWFVDEFLGDIRRIGPDGEITRLVTRTDDVRYFKNPQLLPGARYLLTHGFDPEGLALVLAIEIETGEPTILFEGGYSPRYLPSGHLLFAQRGVLLAMTFDPSTLETGEPVPVLSGLRTDPGDALASYSVSETGTLAYLTGVDRNAEETHLVRLSPGAEPRRLHVDPISASYAGLRVSHDGTRVVYQSNTDLFLFDLERGRLDRRLTRSTGNDAFPVWSVRGEVAYMSNGRPEGWALVAKGSGEGDSERILVPGASTKYPGSWSPDGSTLLYTEQSAETQSDLWTLNIDEAGTALFRGTTADEKWPTISPDGRWVAFVSDEVDDLQIWVASYPGGRLVERVTTSGGVAPRWGPDGKLLYFARGGRVMVMDVLDSATFETGEPRVFVDGIDKNINGHGWDLTPDGESVIALEARPPQQLHLVLNWFEELERLVPAK